MAITPPKNYRLYTGFGRDPDDDVNHLALDTLDALAGHLVFTKLPVSLVVVAQQQVAFEAAVTASRKGGSDRILLKNQAKQVLVDSLVQNALYCQGVARHDKDTLLTSGYEVINNNRASGPLDTPAIIAMFNNVTCELTVRGQGVVNGRMYKARSSTDGGKTWTEWVQFNGARLMVLAPTIPGTNYMVEFCAMGGSTIQSPWSNPVTIMST